MTGSEASSLYDYFSEHVPSVPVQTNSDGDFLRTLRIYPLLYSEARRSCGILETAPLAGMTFVSCRLNVLQRASGHEYVDRTILERPDWTSKLAT